MDPTMNYMRSYLPSLRDAGDGAHILYVLKEATVLNEWHENAPLI